MTDISAINEKLVQFTALASGDPLSMSNSENPNAQITQMLFDGTNFVAWSRHLRRALGAKLKLGFLTGTVEKPAADSKDLPRWIRCNEMVLCWILNSMKPDIANSFVLVDIVQDLWSEIVERYSHSNAPLLFQLKQELLKVTQGGLSVTTYYTKLKKCWDELQCLNAIPACTCGIMNKCTCKILARIQELENQERLLHFLVNLNSDFDSIKSQILAMEPLPPMNRAYYLVLQVEQQKQISTPVVEPSAFMAGYQHSQGSHPPKRDGKKPESKDKKHCTACNSDGHLAESCFEIIGYPDWYKGKKGKRGSRVAANVAHEQGGPETPLTQDDGATAAKYKSLDPDFIQAMYQEMMKMHRGSSPMPTSSANYAGPFE